MSFGEMAGAGRPFFRRTTNGGVSASPTARAVTLSVGAGRRSVLEPTHERTPFTTRSTV